MLEWEEHSHGTILLEKLSLSERNKKYFSSLFSVLVLNYNTSTSYENRSSVHQERKYSKMVKLMGSRIR